MRLWAITTVEEFTVAVLKQGILSDSPPGSMEIASSFELYSCPMGLPPHPQWCNLFWSFRLMWNETKFLGGGVLLLIILQFPRALHILPWLVLHLKCLVCTVLPTWFSISTSWLGRGSRAFAQCWQNLFLLANSLFLHRTLTKSCATRGINVGIPCWFKYSLWWASLKKKWKKDH